MKVIVTGGSAGLGASITEKFLRRGHEVWSLDRQEPAAEAHWLKADLKDLADPERGIYRLWSLFGGDERTGPALRADILINNAGHYDAQNYSFMHDPERHQAVWALNYLVPMALIEFLNQNVPDLRTVNVASCTGLDGGSNIAYATSKAALISATKCLGLAGEDVYAVAPGIIAGTGMFSRIPEETKETYLEHYGCFDTKEHVADLIYYLAVEKDDLADRGACLRPADFPYLVR